MQLLPKNSSLGTHTKHSRPILSFDTQNGKKASLRFNCAFLRLGCPVFNYAQVKGKVKSLDNFSARTAKLVLHASAFDGRTDGRTGKQPRNVV